MSNRNNKGKKNNNGKKKATNKNTYIQVTKQQPRKNKQPKAPKMVSKGRMTSVTHSEYVQDIITGGALINGATVFFGQELGVNPGNDLLFPWLATIAASFTQYEFKRLVFEFRSLSADALNSTNTALGSVIQSMNYDALSPAFNAKQAQENYEYAKSCRPSRSMEMNTILTKAQTAIQMLYVATPSTTPSGDLRLYNIGNYQISTVGMQATNVTLGELWVHYEVNLYKPQIPLGGLSAFTKSDHLTGFASNSTHMFGTSLIGGNPSSTIGCTAQNNTLSFPQSVTSGLFHIAIVISTATPSTIGAITLTATNCTTNSLYESDPYVQSPGAGTITTDQCVVIVVLEVTGPGAALNFGAGVFTTSPTIATSDCVVTSLGINQI